jgi:hypothetical protein
MQLTYETGYLRAREACKLLLADVRAVAADQAAVRGDHALGSGFG